MWGVWRSLGLELRVWWTSGCMWEWATERHERLMVVSEFNLRVLHERALWQISRIEFALIGVTA